MALDAMASVAGDLAGDDENRVLDYVETVSRQDADMPTCRHADAHIRARAKNYYGGLNKS